VRERLALLAHLGGDGALHAGRERRVMVMLNDIDRYHLVIDVIDRAPGLGQHAALPRQDMIDTRLRARAYTREHGDDPPELRDWVWSGA
jgi:xylulose-5-phosphate/fructose-6-phosphate phosphoketolase